MFRTILVPLDGSPFGEFALPYAVDLARGTGATLHLVHSHLRMPHLELEAITPYQFEGVDLEEYETLTRKEEEEYLRQQIERIGEPDGFAVESALVEGRTANSLECYAEEIGADLIVMTTHGRTGLSRAWLGSVADALVRHTRRPVFLVRPEEESPDPSERPTLERILVPLDGSDLAEGILEPAATLGSALGSRFVMFMVVTTDTTVGGRTMTMPEADLSDRSQAAEDYLCEVGERLRKRSLDVECTVVEASTPAQAILDAAIELEVDAIAMATHGHGGLARVVLGSVADKVLRGTSLPILLERPEGA